MVPLIPFCLVLADIKYIVHIALPKQPIDQFKQVIHNRKQELRASCPNIYTDFKITRHRNGGVVGEHCGLSFEIAWRSICQNFWKTHSCTVLFKFWLLATCLFLNFFFLCKVLAKLDYIVIRLFMMVSPPRHTHTHTFFLVDYKIKKTSKGEPCKMSNIYFVHFCWNLAQLKKI